MWLIIVHSLAVGVFLLFLTRWGVAFGGWENVTTLFFPRQAGIFHVVVATGYALEYTHYRGVTLMVTAKAMAVAFLGIMWAVDGGPWVVPISALGDGLMATAVVLVRRLAHR